MIALGSRPWAEKDLEKNRLDPKNGNPVVKYGVEASVVLTVVALNHSKLYTGLHSAGVSTWGV